MATIKILLTVLALFLLLSLLGSICTFNLAVAADDEAKWCQVNIPAEGETGNWVLAGGSDIWQLALSTDGTFYAYTTPSGTSYTLFRSTDGGYSWSPTGRVTEAIVKIVTVTDDADTIYYATAANVYKSADAGNSFSQLPVSPGGAGSDNITITSIDVTRPDGNCIVAVGTRDADASQYGGVYTLDENQPLPVWRNTNIGNYDACALAFSPNFGADRQLVVVATNETDAVVSARIGDTDWGQIIGDANIAGMAPISAAIAFPDDYDATTGDCILFVAIDTGSDNGDVYLVNGVPVPGNSMAIDLNIGSIYNLSNVDVTSLAISGNTTTASLLAGAASSLQIYISSDGGSNWRKSRQEPTGQSITELLAPDFASRGTAYAATSGTESALSGTSDGGLTWNQMGLIDTKISQSGLIDLAVSPNYGEDNALYMLTFNGEHIEHSLWRSLNGGAKWERILTSTQADADSLNLVELSPNYSPGNPVVFLAGTSDGNSVIWKSIDSGQTFTRLVVPFPIDTWVAASDDTLFLGSYDGSDGLVYRTTDSGYSYSAGAAAGSQPLESIVLSPNYEQDKNLLVGNSYGQVYWSEDNGASFKRLGQQLPLSSTDLGQVTATFDPEFSSNKIVYAASDAKATAESKARIYRFIIGQSNAWESIDATLPVGSMLSQLAVSTYGVLYATSSQSVDTGEGGIERSLNPVYPLGPAFETVTRGLDSGATLTGLWLSGSKLWSIDTTDTRLMSYTDSLARPVTLTLPADETPGISTGNVSLDWEALPGATSYQWQLNYDTDFSTIAAGFEGDTTGSSARLPTLGAATGYYWRVRATKPVLSPWSAKWSFITSLGPAGSSPELYYPEAGANGVPIRPAFQWGAIAGAGSYELLVGTDASLANPVIVKIGDYALPTTAWQSDISLTCSTIYYWKVRARGSNTFSAWSAVSVFTTESPSPQSTPVPELAQPTLVTQVPSSPQSPPSLPPSPPPQASAQTVLPQWVLYLVGTLTLTIILLLTTLLVLVLKIR